MLITKFNEKSSNLPDESEKNLYLQLFYNKNSSLLYLGMRFKVPRVLLIIKCGKISAAIATKSHSQCGAYSRLVLITNFLT